MKSFFKKDVEIFKIKINLFILIYLIVGIVVMLPINVLIIIPLLSAGPFITASIWVSKLALDIGLIVFFIYLNAFNVRGKI